LGLDIGLRTSHSAYCVIERVETESRANQSSTFWTWDDTTGERVFTNSYRNWKRVFQWTHLWWGVSDFRGRCQRPQEAESYRRLWRGRELFPYTPSPSHPMEAQETNIWSFRQTWWNFLNLISARRVKIADGIPHRDLLFGEMRIYRLRHHLRADHYYYSAGSGHRDILMQSMLDAMAGASELDSNISTNGWGLWVESVEGGSAEIEGISREPGLSSWWRGFINCREQYLMASHLLVSSPKVIIAYVVSWWFPLESVPAGKRDHWRGLGRGWEFQIWNSWMWICSKKKTSREEKYSPGPRKIYYRVAHRTTFPDRF